jgi:tRNA threonylcarbamoyladenosine dehydratase
VRAVNPQACTRVVVDGVQGSNVQESVASGDVVIDGVDGSESACWPVKYALHEAAARLRRPVISGYALDGTRYLRFYDYRRARAPFDGAVRREQIAVDGIRDLLRRVVPLRVVPVEVPAVARRSVATGEESTAQLLDESMRFGALAARMAVDALDGRPVHRHTVVPAHRAVGTRRPPSGP